DRDARQALEEVDVEEGAAELAVGDALQPHVLLALHHPADAVVLDRAQPVVVERAGRMPLARLDEAPGAQEAADVVGPERRCLGHPRGLLGSLACLPRVIQRWGGVEKRSLSPLSIALSPGERAAEA